MYTGTEKDTVMDRTSSLVDKDFTFFVVHMLLDYLTYWPHNISTVRIISTTMI